MKKCVASDRKKCSIWTLKIINMFSLTVVDSLEKPNITTFISDFFFLLLPYKYAQIKELLEQIRAEVCLIQYTVP